MFEGRENICRAGEEEYPCTKIAISEVRNSLFCGVKIKVMCVHVCMVRLVAQH